MLVFADTVLIAFCACWYPPISLKWHSVHVGMCRYRCNYIQCILVFANTVVAVLSACFVFAYTIVSVFCPFYFNGIFTDTVDAIHNQCIC